MKNFKAIKIWLLLSGIIENGKQKVYAKKS